MSTPFNFKRVGDADFEFTTDLAVQYRATFADTTPYFPNHPAFSAQTRAFYFQILKNPYDHIPINERVGTTISFRIMQFFEQNPEGVIFFIHDASDGREGGRRRLFESWFQSHLLSKAMNNLINS